MRYLLQIAFFLIIANASAQQAQRTVIMINGKTHLADVAQDGSIIARYQQIPDYFNGTLSDDQVIASIERSGLQSDGQISFYASDLDDNTPPILSSFSYETEVPNSEERFILFSRNRAILNQQAVDKIRSIADQYEVGRLNQITMQAYYSETEASVILARNRTKAIKDLLMTFGMPENQISIETVRGNQDAHPYIVYLTIR